MKVMTLRYPGSNVEVYALKPGEVFPGLNGGNLFTPDKAALVVRSCDPDNPFNVFDTVYDFGDPAFWRWIKRGMADGSVNLEEDE